MRIRKATSADIPLLSRLNVPVQEMHAKGEPGYFKMPSGDDFAMPFWELMFEHSNNHVWIAEEGGEAVGHIFVRVGHRDENPFMHASDYMYIDQVAVQPEHQGQGIGEALMDVVLQFAREHMLDFIALDTWAFNTEAHGFFEKQGYAEYNKRMWIKLGV
jgi:ribosomal protein S18 acetylase RimI-like enzyme